MKKKTHSYSITNKRLAQRKYMSFNALQQTARDFGIRTRYKYERWVKKDKPHSVPLHPWRVYEEWTTWGDFLGTDNVFIPYHKWKVMRQKNWRTYWEAARWVQQQNYKTSKKFIEAYERGEIPDDIPKCPTQVYNEKYRGGWTGWKNFLGTTIQRKIEVMQNITKLFAITGVSGYPQNYFMVINAPEGIDDLREQLDEYKFKIYEYDETNQKELGRIVTEIASSQGANVYLCNNMNHLFFELDSTFLMRKDLEKQILTEISSKKTTK